MLDDITRFDDSSDETVYEDGNTVYENDGALFEEGSSSTDNLNKDSLLLGTYRIDSDAIQGGMGSVWRVHHMNWDTDLALKRPKKEFFVTDKQKDAFIHECDAWINLGLPPSDPKVEYILSKIESFSERKYALEQLKRDYYEALRYMEEDEYEAGYVNLEVPDFQRKTGLSLLLPGTEEYFLRNTSDGVEIGGYLFDDEFRGLMPLFDKQIVQCRDRAYRLIYQYTGVR